MYRVKKVLNNNALLVVDLKNDQEVILLATGIGYNQKAEAEIEIPETAATKYVLFENEQEIRSCFAGIERCEKEAGMDEKKDWQVQSLCEWLENMVHHLERNWSLHIDLNSFSYSRLLVHLCYLLARQDKASIGQPDIHHYVKQAFPLAYALSLEIAASLQKSWGVMVHEPEIGMLALHVERILQTDPGESRECSSVKEGFQV